MQNCSCIGSVIRVPERMPRKSPAYVIIADEMRTWIERGDYAPGDKLPNERQLVEEFGVARMTVRHALDILQMEALIDRRRGRTGGTFVKGVPPTVELTRLEGLMIQLRQRGLSVYSKVLSATMMEATVRISQSLHLPPHAPVLNIVRLRSVDTTPLLIENSYYPADLVPGMLEEDLTGSMYELMQKRWDMAPTRKWEIISPGIPSQSEQTHLNIPRNVPIMRIQRVAQSRDGSYVEYSDDAVRSDIAKIKVVTEE